MENEQEPHDNEEEEEDNSLFDPQLGNLLSYCVTTCCKEGNMSERPKREVHNNKT